jgi:excisionase family DNA binding protein
MRPAALVLADRLRGGEERLDACDRRRGIAMRDAPHPDLAALLADPARVPELSLEHVQSLLCQLAAIQIAPLARLAATPTPTTASTVPDPLLTQEEAARQFRIPLRSMRRLTRTKRIPSTRIGRNRMVRIRDLEDYLSRSQRQGVVVGTMLDV